MRGGCQGGGGGSGVEASTVSDGDGKRGRIFAVRAGASQSFRLWGRGRIT